MTELEELIKKCLQKDQRAEYELYNRCFQPLMRICWRYTKNEDDASALLNKGFLKILIHLGKYDPGQPFESWSKRIMVNTIIDEFRMNRKNREVFRSVDMEELPQSYHPFDLNTAEQKLSADEILDEVKKLPAPSREVFSLFVFDGLNHKEIGKALGIPEGTSRWHLANARASLKQQLAALLSSVKTLVL